MVLMFYIPVGHDNHILNRREPRVEDQRVKLLFVTAAFLNSIAQVPNAVLQCSPPNVLVKAVDCCPTIWPPTLWWDIQLLFWVPGFSLVHFQFVIWQIKKQMKDLFLPLVSSPSLPFKSVFKKEKEAKQQQQTDRWGYKSVFLQFFH